MDDAIAHLNDGQTVQNNMAGASPNNAFEMQLRAYMQSQLNNGYNLELIKTTLISRGYNPGLVNKVASDLNNLNINIKHEVHVSNGTIFGIIAAIIIVGIAVFGIFNLGLFQPKDSLLDISVSTTAYSYIPGETVNYQIHVTNMGSMERFDATIKCLIVDDAGNIITRKEETLALETTASVNRNIPLPMNIKTGRYDLKIIADYGTKEAKTSAAIEIVPSVLDKKPEGYIPPITQIDRNVSDPDPPSVRPSTGTIPTVDPDYVYVQPQTSKTPSEISFGEKLTGVKQTAASDPELASATCARLASSEQKDICYSVVADTSKHDSYCDRITEAEYKDNCYLSFLINMGDVSVCDKISDVNNKEFCNQLKLIQLMDVYYKEGNSDKILELSKQLNPDIYGNTPEIQTYEHIYSEPITITDIMGSGEEVPSEIPGETVAEGTVVDENTTV